MHTQVDTFIYYRSLRNIHIAFSAKADEVARLFGFFFEILSQTHDEVVYRPGLYLGVVSPDFFQKFAPGEHPVGL